jgi:23S rRNA pseudouridine1911/1915/1917 synthase
MRNTPRNNARRLTILHEDDEILVVDKPAGLLTIPTDRAHAGIQDSLLGRVREYLARPRGPRRYVGVLHRLDRGTSGALALALTREAHAAGRELFAAHQFARHYLALVHGVPDPPEGTIRVPIADRYVGGRRGVARAGESARDAVTRYTVLEPMGRASLVALELGTGRQHQIRAHLEHIGHPIVGETVYNGGAGRPISAPRPMLHAWKLAFDHPLRGTLISVEADPPADFLETLSHLDRRRRE